LHSFLFMAFRIKYIESYSEKFMDDQYNRLTESIEDLGRQGFRLIQRRNGYRYGEDTVLLSHFASLQLPGNKRMVRAVELGANNGAASLLLLARRPNFKIVAIEKQDCAFELLVRNINLNHQSDVIVPVLGDIRDIKNLSEVIAAENDLCFCNPPYFRVGSGPVPNREDNEDRLESRFEVHGVLEDFLSAASYSLRFGGIFVMVHRAGRLAEVCELMRKQKIEPTQIRFIHPDVTRPATAFLICGKKSSASGGFKVLPPLILRDTEGQICQELNDIYNSEG